jgi:Fic family protein
MLISLMAVRGGLLDVPILYMSPVLERHKDEYIEHMFNVSVKGDWPSWINFFCRRLTEACRESIITTDNLINLQQEYRAAASSAGRSATLISLVDALFDKTAMSIGEAAERLGVTYPAAKSAIDRLVALDIMTEIRGTYPKVFYSPGIIKASRSATAAR